MNKIARLSNFELIRILAMFLIVLHHCLCHLRALMPIFPNTENIHFINNFIAFLLFSGGKVGVAIFEILTGYFMNPFKLEVFNVVQYQSSPYFATKCITFSFIVFAVCLIIDLILSFLLKPISKVLNDCFCNILEKITERKEVNK